MTATRSLRATANTPTPSSAPAAASASGSAHIRPAPPSAGTTDRTAPLTGVIAGAPGRIRWQIHRAQLTNPLIEHRRPTIHPTRPDDHAGRQIVGTSVSWARIASSNASTADPTGLRTYFGGSSQANADRTVFRETFNVLAINLIGNPSARCNLRISAQSSTANNSLLLSARKPRLRRRGSIRASTRGQFSDDADSSMRRSPGRRTRRSLRG